MPFKDVLKHQFIYECFNDIVPAGGHIIHINKNKQENRLCNLKLVT